MTTVAVIDYGMGNIRSVSKALEYAGGSTQVVVTYDPERILQSDRVVLPGVGALRDCMSELQRLELDEVIREVVKSKPFLGICLGMQALVDESEENNGTPALGIIPGRVLHFSVRQMKSGDGTRLKIPHMGWNYVHQTKSHQLWQGVPQDSRFYFVHSYYVETASKDFVVATTNYGHDFNSVIGRENIFGVQFHPEKSQHVGLTLLSNFLHWDGTV